MLALLATAAFGLYATKHTRLNKNFDVGNSKSASAPYPYSEDPRSRGLVRNPLADRQDSGQLRVPGPQYKDQHPSSRRGILPALPESNADHHIRSVRLAGAMEEGPTFFERKTRFPDRDITMQRMPTLHPGLSRTGSEHRHSSPVMWANGDFVST
jgi:hypothetical protein